MLFVNISPIIKALKGTDIKTMVERSYSLSQISQVEAWLSAPCVATLASQSDYGANLKVFFQDG